MCHPTSIPTPNTGSPVSWREPLVEVPWCTVGLLISTLVRHKVYTLLCCMIRIGSIPFSHLFHELLTPGNIRGVDCFLREGRWACEREMLEKNSSLDFREQKLAQATVISNCIDVVNKLTGWEEDFNFQGNWENSEQYQPHSLPIYCKWFLWLAGLMVPKRLNSFLGDLAACLDSFQTHTQGRDWLSWVALSNSNNVTISSGLH